MPGASGEWFEELTVLCSATDKAPHGPDQQLGDLVKRHVVSAMIAVAAAGLLAGCGGGDPPSEGHDYGKNNFRVLLAWSQTYNTLINWARGRLLVPGPLQ